MDHHFPSSTYDPRIYEQPAPPSDGLMDIPVRFADTLFNQASLLELVLVGMIVSLGLFIHRSETSAKQERARNQEKFENLIIRTQDETVRMASDLSSMSARLDNIEREIESQKDFLFTTLRKA